jgi:hypothetical protein
VDGSPTRSVGEINDRPARASPETRVLCRYQAAAIGIELIPAMTSRFSSRAAKAQSAPVLAGNGYQSVDVGQELDALVNRTAPLIESLLGDGVPRTKRMIIASLNPILDKREVARTIMRMSITGRLVEVGSKYTLPAPDELENGAGEV